MPHEPKPNEIIPTDESDRAVDAFEQVLRRYGIEVAPGSLLEHSCLLLKRQRDLNEAAALGTRTPITEQFRTELQDALGIMSLVRLVVRHVGHADFERLVPHLRLLNLGSALQTLPADYMDKASNKLFELRIGLAAMTSGRDVLVDDPEASSGGDNPDVIATMMDNRRWGFACKVINGDAPMTLYQNIEKGVDQIERSDCDVGVVVVGLKNRLPHDAVFPVIDKAQDRIVVGAHFDWENAGNAMAHACAERFSAMKQHVGVEVYTETFRGKKAVPAVVGAMEAATASVVEGSELPVPTLIAFLQVDQVVDLPVDVLGVLAALNVGWQNKDLPA
jgi:hypothetical protein